MNTKLDNNSSTIYPIFEIKLFDALLDKCKCLINYIKNKTDIKNHEIYLEQLTIIVTTIELLKITYSVFVQKYKDMAISVDVISDCVFNKTTNYPSNLS